MKKCPYCGEQIQDTAKKCKYCGEWLKEEVEVKTPKIKTKKCPYCGEEILSTSKKCKHCNTWIVDNEPAKKHKYCPFCHTAVPENAEKCTNCGEWLKDENQELSCGYWIENPVVKCIAVISAIAIIFSFFVGFISLFDETKGGSTIAGLIMLLFLFIPGLYLYMFPAIMAKARNHPQFIPILIVNLFFGETGLAWIACLIWATTHRLGRHTHW